MIPRKITSTSCLFDLLFLPERKKIKNVEKLVTNLYNKNEYVIHIRNRKQTLNHGLIVKKVHRVIKFNQKDWLKPSGVYSSSN